MKKTSQKVLDTVQSIAEHPFCLFRWEVALTSGWWTELLKFSSVTTRFVKLFNYKTCYFVWKAKVRDSLFTNWVLVRVKRFSRMIANILQFIQCIFENSQIWAFFHEKDRSVSWETSSLRTVISYQLPGFVKDRLHSTHCQRNNVSLNRWCFFTPVHDA